MTEQPKTEKPLTAPPPEKKVEAKRSWRQRTHREPNSTIRLLSTLSILGLMGIALINKPDNYASLRNQQLLLQRSRTNSIQVSQEVEIINRETLLRQATSNNLQGLDPNILIISQELTDKLNQQIRDGLLDETIIKGLIIFQMDIIDDIQFQTTPGEVYAKYEATYEVTQLLESFVNRANMEA